jgi:hypothetical protein
VVGAGATSLVLAQTGDPRTSVVIASGVLMGLLAAEMGAVATRAGGELRERWLGTFRLPAMPPAPYLVASRNLALSVWRRSCARSAPARWFATSCWA